MRQTNGHLAHCLQQDIRSLLVRQPPHETDLQRGRVADDDLAELAGCDTIGDACHTLRRIAQCQRGGLLFAGHCDDRRRLSASQPFDPSIEPAPTRPARHQEWKGVRSVNDRHTAEAPCGSRERTGFGAVRVDQIRADASHATDQSCKRGKVCQRR